MKDDFTQFDCGCEVWTQKYPGGKAFIYRACPDGRACETYEIVKEERERVGIPFMEVDFGPHRDLL